MASYQKSSISKYKWYIIGAAVLLAYYFGVFNVVENKLKALINPKSEGK